MFTFSIGCSFFFIVLIWSSQVRCQVYNKTLGFGQSVWCSSIRCHYIDDSKFLRPNLISNSNFSKSTLLVINVINFNSKPSKIPWDYLGLDIFRRLYRKLRSKPLKMGGFEESFGYFDLKDLSET